MVFGQKVCNFASYNIRNPERMSTILHIETSTEVCSVAVSEDSQVIFQQEDHSGPNHAERLGAMVDEALSFTDNHAIPFDAVAVSSGPGSYTGLRIGVSMAKGICYGRNLKLIAVPTLELLCVPVLLREIPEDDALLCPMLDARRMEVYAGIYNRALKPVREIGADIVTTDTYKKYLDAHPVYFFGNGAKKCMETINHPNARLIEGIEPLAKWMQPLAERRFLNEQFEDVAYYVPYYLKDFVAKKPKDLLNIEH
jgi:tRNA threonylcarbamoyladenosine biosynthesis protein TsaB